VAVELARTGAAAASLVDAALHAIDAEALHPSPDQPDLAKPSTGATSLRRPALIIGSTSIGLAVLGRTHFRLLRSRDPRRACLVSGRRAGNRG
jgi:hypothetical protein